MVSVVLKGIIPGGRHRAIGVPDQDVVAKKSMAI